MGMGVVFLADYDEFGEVNIGVGVGVSWGKVTQLFSFKRENIFWLELSRLVDSRLLPLAIKLTFTLEEGAIFYACWLLAVLETVVRMPRVFFLLFFLSSVLV